MRVIRGGTVSELRSEIAQGEFNKNDWQELPDYYYTDGKIIFIADKKEYWNENFYRPINNLIFEAMVHYIIYKWFTIVFPGEAQFYYGEYSRYAADISKQLSNVNARAGKYIRQHYNPLG
jgi:hypothetical protein